VRALVFGFDSRQRPCHPGAHFAHAPFITLGVFFDQDFAGNLLRRQRGCVGLALGLMMDSDAHGLFWSCL